MKSVMDVKILQEAGYDQSLLAIATNKKQYDKDMTKVAQVLAKAGAGHDKFLEQICVWVDYTCPRFVHQEIDTYRHVSKSSESTNHRLVDDILRVCIDKDSILNEFGKYGVALKSGKAFPYNATHELILAMKHSIDAESKFCEYIKKFYDCQQSFTLETCEKIVFANLHIDDNIDYSPFFTMFEDGENAVCKAQIDKMIDATFNIIDPLERLHALKRMLPESFLQRRVMCLNYKELQNMIDQRFTHKLQHWHMFIKQILEQVQHPELFEKILEKYNANLEDIKNNIYNGRPYVLDI